MRAFSLMFFVVCLNLAALIINLSQMFPISLPISIFSLADLTSQFDLVIFAGLGFGGALAGIYALVTHSGTNASFVLLLWVVGTVLYGPIRWITSGVPLMLTVLLPSSLVFIASIVEAIFMLIFFMFFIEILTQRQIL